MMLCVYNEVRKVSLATNRMLDKIAKKIRGECLKMNENEIIKEIVDCVEGSVPWNVENIHQITIDCIRSEGGIDFLAKSNKHSYQNFTLPRMIKLAKEKLKENNSPKIESKEIQEKNNHPIIENPKDDDFENKFKEGMRKVKIDDRIKNLLKEKVRNSKRLKKCKVLRTSLASHATIKASQLDVEDIGDEHSSNRFWKIRKFIDYLVDGQVQPIKGTGLQKTYVKSNRTLETFDKIKEGVSREDVALISSIENLFLKKLDQITDENSDYNKHYKEITNQRITTKHILCFGEDKLNYYDFPFTINEFIDEHYQKIGACKVSKYRRQKSLIKILYALSNKNFFWKNKKELGSFKLLYFNFLGNFKGEITGLVSIIPNLLKDVGFGKERYLLESPIKGNHYTLLERFSEDLGFYGREILGGKSFMQNKGGLDILIHYIAKTHHFETHKNVHPWNGWPFSISLRKAIALGMFGQRDVKKNATRYEKMAVLLDNFLLILHRSEHIEYLRDEGHCDAKDKFDKVSTTKIGPH